MRIQSPLLLVIVLLLFLFGMSQDDANSPGEIRFQTPAEGIRLRAFVEWLGSHLPGSVTFAPPALARFEDVRAKVVLVKPVRLERADVLAFAQDMLAPHRLVLFNVGTETRPFWLLESLEEPTVLAGRTLFVAPEDMDAHRRSRIPITTLVRLRHRPLRDVIAELERALRWGDRIIPVQAVNGLILKDAGVNLHAALELVRNLDRPAADTEPGPDDRLDRLEKRIDALERKVGS